MKGKGSDACLTAAPHQQSSACSHMLSSRNNAETSAKGCVQTPMQPHGCLNAQSSRFKGVTTFCVMSLLGLSLYSSHVYASGRVQCTYIACICVW